MTIDLRKEIEKICIMKGCNKSRYKDKILCEWHWKTRRKDKSYKEEW